MKREPASNLHKERSSTFTAMVWLRSSPMFLRSCMSFSHPEEVRVVKNPMLTEAKVTASAQYSRNIFGNAHLEMKASSEGKVRRRTAVRVLPGERQAAKRLRMKLKSTIRLSQPWIS